MTPPTSAIVCECGAASESRRALAAEAAELLARRGAPMLRLADLCGAVGRRDPGLVEFARARPLLVVACRPRAVRWLLDAAGVACASGVRVVDLGGPAERVRSEIAAAFVPPAPRGDAACHCLSRDDAAREGRRSRDQAAALDAPTPPAGWVPWFPVVDEDRCQRCGQCASYCVFGVYTPRADGGVTVARPSACKTNCPACARICPSAAIMFPKHDEAPFDGSAIGDEEAVQARTRQYAQQMLGQDPYATLEARRRRAELLRQPLAVRVPVQGAGGERV
jgi:ferredoxin